MKSTVLTTLAEVKEYFEPRNFSTCSFDTETTGLNYYTLNMRGCSFCNGKDAVYIDIFPLGDREGIISFISNLFQNHIKFLIMHNAPFDLKVLHKEGITEVTDKIFCTMTAAHLIDENRSKGLKDLAKRYLKEKPLDYSEAIVDGFQSEKFYTYATNDAIWTWELHKIFNKKLYQFGMNRLFFEVEMPFQFVLMDMSINGILVDENKLEELRIDASVKRLELQRKLYEMGNLPYSLQPDLFTGDVELVSKHKLSAKTLLKIFAKRKLESPFLTDGGAMSTGKETLTFLRGDKFVDQLVKFRIVDKLLNGFINKLPDFIDEDGRVRCSFNNAVAVTGRLSSSGPNMQQLPKVNPELPFDYREIFTVEEGKVIVVVDYSGQELRILGVVSKDEVLLDAFKTGKDLHLMTANNVFKLGIPEEVLVKTHPKHKEYRERYDHERHIGKNGYNFPIIYGTTAYGIAKNNGISEEEAERGIEAFFGAYPRVRQAIRWCSQFLTKNWHVRSLTGRRRRLDPDIKKSHRQAFNFLIQSVGADMLRCATNKLRKLFLAHAEWDAKTLLVVHDEIVLEINEGSLDRALPKIKEACETAMNLSVEMEVDVGTGKNYSDAK